MKIISQFFFLFPCNLFLLFFCCRPNGGWAKVAIGTGVGWVLGGKIHSSRKAKKLASKHKEEQKALYTQYYNDVYTLQQQNQELAKALEQMGVRVN
jgi:hypothetical protein